MGRQIRSVKVAGSAAAGVPIRFSFSDSPPTMDLSKSGMTLWSGTQDANKYSINSRRPKFPCGIQRML